MAYAAKNKKGIIEDMVLLSKITEDEIVENLRKRYSDDLIYVSLSSQWTSVLMT